MKNYKQALPIDTVYRIKEVLKNIGIITKDIHYGRHPFYSCRILIGNSELFPFNIGTNGKGITFEYSMASGYAEFMERLQNQILFSVDKKKFATKNFLSKLPQNSTFARKIFKDNISLDFVYDPNELEQDIKEIILESTDELKAIFDIDTEKELVNFLVNEIKLDKETLIPFYSVKECNEKLLPIELLMNMTGSNGMCAGNTTEEALVQGFCEIFERYVARELYYKEITPPDIPWDYFKETPAYNKLLYIKNSSDFEVIIKDCSLSKQLPVIGVLFLNKKTKQYNFKLGADFIPHVALERCLTEIFQGSNKIPTLPIKFFSIKNFIGSDQMEDSINYNFEKIFTNHSGYWPMSLFSDVSSYEFKGFNSSYGLSERSDLKYCTMLIDNLGYDIYVRDNSILGFPTYYIVVPGMSQINTKEMYKFYKTQYSNINIKSLYSIDKEKAFKIASIIDGNYTILSKYINYTNLYLYNIDENLIELEIELLAFMLFFYIGNIDKAKKYLDIFLMDKNNRYEYNFYFAVSDFINLKFYHKIENSYIERILNKCYDSYIVKEVISTYSDNEKSFEYYYFPNCFNCENCPVNKTCHYTFVVKLHSTINNIYKSKRIKQINLKKIFETI